MLLVALVVGRRQDLVLLADLLRGGGIANAGDGVLLRLLWVLLDVAGGAGVADVAGALAALANAIARAHDLKTVNYW